MGNRVDEPLLALASTLKLLRPELVANAEAVARFTREARAAVRISSELPAVSLNKKGTLLIYGSNDAETVSLSIRAKDGRMILRDNDFAESFTTSKVKRIAIFVCDGFAGAIGAGHHQNVRSARGKE